MNGFRLRLLSLASEFFIGKAFVHDLIDDGFASTRHANVDSREDGKSGASADLAQCLLI